MKIESIRLKNFKAFRDVHLRELPNFCVVVGANGSGKTTLFDVFGFLHDCLKGNVRQALDSRGRFQEVISRDSKEKTILIELQYRMDIVGVDRLVTYSLEIGEKKNSTHHQTGNPSIQARPSRQTVSLSRLPGRAGATRSPMKKTSTSRMKSSPARIKPSMPPTFWPSRVSVNSSDSKPQMLFGG